MDKIALGVAAVLLYFAIKRQIRSVKSGMASIDGFWSRDGEENGGND